MQRKENGTQIVMMVMMFADKRTTSHLKNVFGSFFSYRAPLSPSADGESALYSAARGSPFRESEGSKGKKNIFEMASILSSGYHFACKGNKRERRLL